MKYRQGQYRLLNKTIDGWMINNINFELMDKYPRLDLVDQGLKVLGFSMSSLSKSY